MFIFIKLDEHIMMKYIKIYKIVFLYNKMHAENFIEHKGYTIYKLHGK